MTGIERLRRVAELFSAHGMQNMLANDLSDIADQIEREQDALVKDSPYDAILPEDAEAVAWVREHGGLENVKASLAALELFAEGIEMDTGIAFYDESIGERCVALRNEVKSRLMPEDYEWPRYEDGLLLRFDDPYIGDDGNNHRAWQIRFDSNADVHVSRSEDGDGFNRTTWDHFDKGERVRRPSSKVLDADGAEIRVGDKVWTTRDLSKFIVTNTNNGMFLSVSCKGEDGEDYCCYPTDLTHRAPVLAGDGKPLREGETVWNVKTGERYVVGAFAGGCVNVSDGRGGGLQLLPSQLTHERPESWERLEEDAEKGTCVYFGQSYGCGLCSHYPSMCIFDKARDLVRRAKALAGDA